jgi:hypothetical protein
MRWRVDRNSTAMQQEIVDAVFDSAEDAPIVRLVETRPAGREHVGRCKIWPGPF